MPTKNQGYLYYVIFVLIALLMFVWPIERTIALRYSVAALAFAVCVLFVYKNSIGIVQVLARRQVAIPNLLLLALTLWFLVQWLFIAKDPDGVISEIQGQWIKYLFFWVLGVFVAAIYESCAPKNRGINVLIAIVLGLVAIVLWNVFASLILWVESGNFPMMHSVTGGRATDSYVNNALLAFLVGDFLARQSTGKLLPWGSKTSVFLLLCCVVNTCFIGARNGWIGLGLLAFSWLFIHYIIGRRNLGKKSLFLLPLMVALLLIAPFVSIKLDSRWNTLRATLPIAWDIDASKNWLNPKLYPPPVLSDGQVVDGSNYERPAWIHVGMRMVKNNPLGVGFSRHAFGQELARMYPESDPPAIHSHSGIIDFAVGAGVPGLVLWLCFIVALVWSGSVAFFRYGGAAGIVLVFITTGFFGRSLLDSTMRDHMLEQFLFLAGFLVTVISRYFPKTSRR